jgi:3-hydroxyacyl-CoA dehydrogenase
MTTSDVSVEQVAILGCGLIGASWAALVVDAGITVTAWDPDEKVRIQRCTANIFPLLIAWRTRLRMPI